jgi:hypothetical protein
MGISFVAETPAFRSRQLHDETKSCGNQPAHIRVINRRLRDDPVSDNEFKEFNHPHIKGALGTYLPLTNVNHIRDSEKNKYAKIAPGFRSD